MLSLKILPQPDDSTCGPTSLHAVYNFFEDPITLADVIREVSYLKGGGTLAVMLGIHALRRGYQASIYTYNLRVFDPTWFQQETNLAEKLREQLKYKSGKKLVEASTAYLEFLDLGGRILYQSLSSKLLNQYLDNGIPVLTGLSATYLYQCSREYTTKSGRVVYDDTRGSPQGHFVVLSGYDETHDRIVVADPYLGNPVSNNNYYAVHRTRLIHSILLGIVTYDANMLVIKPKALG